MSTPEAQVQEQPPVKDPENKAADNKDVQQDPAPEKGVKPEPVQDAKAEAKPEPKADKPPAKAKETSKGKEAARAKAEGLLDYMFGKRKEEEAKKGCEHMAIGEQIDENPLEMEFMKDFIDVVPEKVQFDDLPQIRDSRKSWSAGMRKIEDMFSEHLSNMHLEFEEKADKYEKVQDQLTTNLEFFEQFYVAMQKKLNDKFYLIQKERDDWELEKEEIQKMHKIDSEIISLNVGGRAHIHTAKDVLTSVEGSKLAALFSEMHELKKVDDEVFLDRDGSTFETLVNYLRNERKIFPEFTEKNAENMFFKELQYWGIEQGLDSHLKGLSLPEKIEPKPQRQIPQRSSLKYDRDLRFLDGPSDISQQNVDDQPYRNTVKKPYSTPLDESSFSMDDSEGFALKAVKDKWNQLGPLNLEEIIANSSIPVDSDLPFGRSRYDTHIEGQMNSKGRITGVGKEINNIIYEGQLRDDIYHGYGRYIYTNGNHYTGNWIDGKRQGYGKLVDISGKHYAGIWKNNTFLGS